MTSGHADLLVAQARDLLLKGHTRFSFAASASPVNLADPVARLCAHPPSRKVEAATLAFAFAAIVA